MNHARIKSHCIPSKTSNQCISFPPFLFPLSWLSHKTPKSSFARLTFPIPKFSSNLPNDLMTISLSAISRHSHPAMKSGKVSAEYSQWRGSRLKEAILDRQRWRASGLVVDMDGVFMFIFIFVLCWCLLLLLLLLLFIRSNMEWRYIYAASRKHSATIWRRRRFA